jgi:tetratricopeptide (TPR) repeat protein
MEASNALMALGQHQEALDCAQQAYQHALTLGENDLLRLASTSAVLAMAYTANGYLQKAHPLYQAAITFYDHMR